MHSTNYTNTFIEVADDCKVESGVLPPTRETPTIARMQYDLIHNQPYHYTSDDLLFTVYATRNQLSADDLEAERARFFSKGQPCLRASPLGKTYSWGIHFDDESRIAIYSKGSPEYAQFQQDPTLNHLKAVRSSR